MRFFFQAEDGIRDTSVTGVQTCALPISTNQITPRGLQYLRLQNKLPLALSLTHEITDSEGQGAVGKPAHGRSGKQMCWCICDEHHPDVGLRFADETQNDPRQGVTGRNRQRGRADAYGRGWAEPLRNRRRKLQYAEQRQHRADQHGEKSSCQRDAMREGIEEIANPAVKGFVRNEIGIPLRIQPQDTALHLVSGKALMVHLAFGKETLNIARWRNWSSHG